MSSNNIVYRSATLDDIDGIMELWLESVDYHEVLDSRMSLNKDAIDNVRKFYSNKYFKDDSMLEVALYEGKIIGVLGAFIQESPPIHFDRKRGFIDIAFVSKKHRHHGIGTILFERVLKWFKSAGLHKLRLYVASQNPTGINFWKKIGFDDLMQTMEMTI